MMRPIACLLTLAGLLTGEPRLEMQFFHDEDESTLQINDLKFPSPSRGIACGFRTEKGNVKPVVLVTSNGGENWSFVRTKGVGISLFFLNDSLGWMVSDGRVWQTEESGRSWQRLSKVKNVERVFFLDENHGYAVGARKSVYETHDGGRKWQKLPIAGEPKTSDEYTTYGWIDFADSKVGSIAGWSRPPRRDRRQHLPDWMEPERAERRRQWPSLSIVLQTADGGKTWRQSTTSMFGRIIRVRTGSGNRGLGVVWFDDAFDYPSEVYRIESVGGKAERVYREPDRAVTDALLTPKFGYLAAVEPPGKLRQSPIPGRLVLVRSGDLSNWEELEVDYRAVARRPVLAAAGERIWVATDTGMILRLTD